jgi:glycine/serine hydroxymethyltransferase
MVNMSLTKKEILVLYQLTDVLNDHQTLLDLKMSVEDRRNLVKKFRNITNKNNITWENI